MPKIPVGYPLKRNRTGETSNQPERLDREEVVFVPLWGLSHCSTRSVCHDGAAWAVLSARIRCRKEAVTALSLGLLASCWALHNSRYGVPSRTKSKGSTPRSGAKPADIWTQGRKGNRGGRTVGSAITSWSPLASGLKASWRNRRVSVSLSPTLTLFLAPQGKLYLRLQERVPESVSARLAASPPPKTMASYIAIPDVVPSSYRFSNGYPK